MFPSEYNVYLHRTPSPELFARPRRDFSHGCIRVEDPVDLTTWVLRNNPGWDKAHVHSAMQTGKDNTQVNLSLSSWSWHVSGGAAGPTGAVTDVLSGQLVLGDVVEEFPIAR